MLSALEKEWPETIAGQPELLAYHYSMARNPEFAALYWLSGGRRARSRSANLEAIVQFQNALEFLELLPNSPERMAKELEVQLSLGLCFIAVRGYSSDDTRKSFERARSLSAEIGDPQKEIQATFGLWGHYWMRARHDQALEHGETLLARAEQLRDPLSLSVGHRVLGSTLFTAGEFVRAREHLERAVALGLRAATENASLSYAVDPRIAAQLMLAWDCGYWAIRAGSSHRIPGARRWCRSVPIPTRSPSPNVASAVHCCVGSLPDSLLHADRSLAVSSEHRIDLYALYSRFGRGCALARMGQEEQAISEIRAGIEDARRSNLGYMRGFMLGWLAAVQIQTGDPETALSTIDNALAQISDVSGRAWEAELRRLRADAVLAVRPDAAAEAERGYNEAIAIAQKQQARSLELRATTSLARLLQGQGRSQEARARLGRRLRLVPRGVGYRRLDRGEGLARTAGMSIPRLRLARMIAFNFFIT